jgi:DNA-directed RNA polymerase specialized sigma24 family protein
MGERMSANLIALLYGSVEPPGMPPLVPAENVLADRDEGLSAAQVDFTMSESSATDTTETDPVEPETIGAEPGQENPTRAADEIAVSADTQAPGRDPDLWLYRDRTVALLRRYMRLSIEVGRMPSLLGREFFRARVTSYKASTFEDSVIFVHDVERSLEELNEFEKKLIAKIVLQQYSKEEAGRLLGCGYRTVERLFPETLDRVSEILLRREILSGLPKSKREVPKTCQEGKTGHFLASD